MAENRKVIIDAGHGGAEPGATYQGRREKDDTLRLALAVGQILTNNGVTVAYTRVTDVYQTPLEKAQMANNWNADYFLSIHRNAMPIPGTASGTESLVYSNEGTAALLARNINNQLEGMGWKDLGIIERPGLIVLRRTEMPAVLVEAGFIDNEIDNEFYDDNFQRTAQAIADGVLETLEEEETGQQYYQIQVGAYENRQTAQELADQLTADEFPAFLVAEDGLYKVRVGAFLNIDNAAWMEKRLRAMGYPTVMLLTKAIY